MLHDYSDVYTLSIVFLGEFNPSIIQPFWLAEKELIREGEADSAKIELIHNDLVRFELDWVRFEIVKQRFELRSSKEPYFEAVRDLAISIFEILKETPLNAVGINHIKNFSLRTEKEYNDIGNRLAPFKNWNNFFSDPKLLQLEMVDLKRKDKLYGNFRVKVSASDANLNIRYGVAFNINDHYTISPGSKGRNGEIVKILSEQWKLSMENATEVIESVWTKLNEN